MIALLLALIALVYSAFTMQGRVAVLRDENLERVDSAQRELDAAENINGKGSLKMANNNSNSNQINVPEARKAMYDMKHEVANELGITLNDGYNGNMSSKDAGHIGGNMVRKMIEAQERQMSGNSRG